MSTIDIPRSYHHYHLSVAIIHVLLNVTQNIGIIGTSRREEEEEEEEENQVKRNVYTWFRYI
jgi:hypothetical protein